MRSWLLALLLVGCGSAAPTTDSGLPDPDDAGQDGGVPDAGLEDAGHQPDAGADSGTWTDAGADSGTGLVTVAVDRELRGVWVSTVSNLDWPSTQGQSPNPGRASLEKLVSQLADAGFNTLFFQVRPESDALYESTLEPWSRFLSGTQGVNPGWDPLATLLDLAHARGLEVHAWLNPYRALVSTNEPTALNHVSNTLAADAVTYNNQVVMDPSSLAVRAHVLAVVHDLLGRYDVDGIHFDDYFYPYPDAVSTPYPDDARYAGYQADGGTLSKADWRRDNVNQLVSQVMTVVKSEHPTVRFGVSPFGIWKAGTPAGVTGLSSYSAISCDSVTWMNEGWVDYLAPQLYWTMNEAGHGYSTLASWWASGTKGGRHLFPGHAASKVGTSSAWTVAEYEAQVTFTRSLRASGALGDVHFRAGNLLAGALHDGVGALYAKPALTPPLPRAGASVAPVPPSVSLAGQVLTATALPTSTRFIAVYAQLPGTLELRAVRGAPTAALTLASGSYVVTAVARGGAESQGVRVTVP